MQVRLQHRNDKERNTIELIKFCGVGVLDKEFMERLPDDLKLWIHDEDPPCKQSHAETFLRNIRVGTPGIKLDSPNYVPSMRPLASHVPNKVAWSCLQGLTQFLRTC